MDILSGNNAELLEELYDRYRKNPSSVSGEWADFFSQMDKNEEGRPPVRGQALREAVAARDSARFFTGGCNAKELALVSLLESYRRHGHLAARIDPLEMREARRDALSLSAHGLSDEDLDIEFDSGIEPLGRATLRKIIEWMEKTYCSSIGAEHHYLGSDAERVWLQAKMESTANSAPLETWERLRLFEKVYQAEHFERFLAQKYVGKKRFSLEGGESLIALLDAMAEESSKIGTEHLIFGMAHRGRLNVLVNFMQKPAGLIFAEFEENYIPGDRDYGDVKYHLGFSSVMTSRSGKEIHLSLAFNPSHLEAVNPIVLGSVRARQAILGDAERKKNLPVLIHGDAAFPGQGIIAETLNLMGLEGYTVGGTVHIVVNNQIGFTTLPHESRSTRYSTDLAKGFQIPVFHVNGDDPEAVFRVVKLALEYRREFAKDVIIDLVCYRRLGHNETDEPTFTQPVLYEKISKHPTTAVLYAERLLQSPELNASIIEYVRNGVHSGLESSFKSAKERNIRMAVDTLRDRWSDFSGGVTLEEPATCVSLDRLERIAGAITTVPSGFAVHQKIERLLEMRRHMFSGENPVDWGFAEAMAFGTILEEGYDIRLSGQDAKRGTFSHRHAAMRSVETNEEWIPLSKLPFPQGRFEVHNSPLSEYSVLGFEFGYSLSDPKTLPIWEAQFGDFSNGAQIIIDQFITCSEVKWFRMSGLVVLLPHGYEGQGPEHSSARPERYLQLCASNNIQAVNCTTSAQYFHVLRRQMLRKFRKPLIIFTPKSLLRLPEAGSSISEFTVGAFMPVIPDLVSSQPSMAKRILFCTGKIYYDLLLARKEKRVFDVAIIRIEQLYPFPEREISLALTQYPNVKEFFWVQEEPENMGAWLYIEDRLKAIPSIHRLSHIARAESPSPASGLLSLHKREQSAIVNQALGL